MDTQLNFFKTPYRIVFTNYTTGKILPHLSVLRFETIFLPYVLVICCSTNTNLYFERTGI